MPLARFGATDGRTRIGESSSSKKAAKDDADGFAVGFAAGVISFDVAVDDCPQPISLPATETGKREREDRTGDGTVINEPNPSNSS